MKKEQSRYSRLANITQVINAKQDLREVLQQVTTAISEEIVQCNSVGIYLPQGDGTYRGYAGKPEFISGMTLQSQVIDPDTDPLAAEMIDTRKTIYIADTSVDSRVDPRAMEDFQIKSLLALPISYEEELFGMVFLFDYGTPMNLEPTEIESVEAYVNMAAVAIQNAKTIAQKEKMLKEKQLLLDLTSELSLCSTIRESLDTCFVYLKQAFGDTDFAAHIVKTSTVRQGHAMKFHASGGITEVEWNEHLAGSGLLESYAKGLADSVSMRQLMRIKLGNSKELLLFPLVSMGKVQGVVSTICCCESAKELEDMQLPLAQSIVDATAPVFSNLLYMDQLEVMVEERTSAV